MMESLLDSDLMANFDAEAFQAIEPFPWYNYKEFIKPEAFEELFNDFPAFELFEKHSDIPRVFGQRPHNRYYLAYENSIYHKEGTVGVVRHNQLATSWQNFIDELRSDTYQRFVRRLFGCDKMETRFAWHMGHTGSEVSPHTDDPKKLGTHLFYFNKSRF